ncbi:M48 family metallopeptidase [Tumebacillus sp. DT12]|uniref:M48 family metallopeptidase n=1 Tax=Tumebacillus lacus TaxID=2995335 RepID=A0ABT3X2K6_9BACL|nr:M48 family metallopeptidase [Tumebacillus lacus]MCX7571143.1 M48 family metallopeptidase [Tumebacillus lacus]
MRKLNWTLPICALILLASFWMAHMVYTDTSQVTQVAKGDPAHPLSFMSAGEWERTVAYSKLKDALYFASVGFEWVIYLFLLTAGLSSRFRDTAVRAFKRSSFGQVAVYTALLQLAITLIELPLMWFRHMVDVNYGISTMTASDWFSELGLDFVVSTLMTIPVIWLAMLIVRKSPQRWWLWFWTATIPLLLFLVVIQPIVLDPLYNDFKPLQNQELKQEILDLAHKADVPSDDVYEVDMSKKTNALNAYVNGLGPSARIVLWDTTLSKLQNDEILFIMGHEMGHYVKNHILWGLGGSLLSLFVLLWVLAKSANGVIRFMGSHWGIRSIDDLAALPAALLLLSMLSFATSPFDNYVQRHHELTADRYAVQITGDAEAGIRSFQKLSRLSLSNPNPSPIVKFFRYTHPTISERIQYLEELEKAQEQNVEFPRK